MSEAQMAVARQSEISGASTSAAAPLSSHMTSHTAPRQITSQELLGRERELLIAHQGRQYRLRVTQNGKLILTA